MLSRKVDVVDENALHHSIRDRVLREATPISKIRCRVMEGPSPGLKKFRSYSL